ncbi:hypothetical protein EIP91_009144 [Steccherinum ochraceum]|uniref:Uncharacterized protein n=1 Tax=Steccherinum ochraceum TaxID=92696 RepID=A0A4R0R203_9APHY|nr:hypothetical protein EIP91_009144 [Steccherinum ochraceum]
MPSFVCTGSSRQRTDYGSLALTSRHLLVAGSPSDNVLKLKTSLPSSVDVLHVSDITFTVSGVLAGRLVSSSVMQQSAVAHHLVSYLQNNADALGIAHMSQLFIDVDDDILKCMPFTMTVSYTRADHFLSHCVISPLSRSKPRESTEGSTFGFDAFGPQAYLPLMSVLDQLLKTFVVHHLVKRYPLIFGRWGDKVRIEMDAFKPLSRAILDVIERSSNPDFQKTSRRLLRQLSKIHTRSVERSSSELSELLASDADIDTTSEQEYGPLGNMDLLHMSLLKLLKLRVRPSRFKVALSSTEDVREEGPDICHTLEPMDDSQPSAAGDHNDVMDDDDDDNDWDAPADDEFEAICSGPEGPSEDVDCDDDWLDSEDTLCNLGDPLNLTDDIDDLVEQDAFDDDSGSQSSNTIDFSGGRYSEESQEDDFDMDADLILDDTAATLPFDDTFDLWLH